MMNVLAISLVLSTLLTAGFLTPNKKEDVVLVVEFDKNDGTKVLISPQEAEIAKEKSKSKSKSGYVSDLKDKLYEKEEEASSVLPNIGQGISSPYVSQDQDQQNGEFHTKRRDVVCDAFGKCKEKIATAFGKTKDKVEESVKGTSEEVKEKAKDVVDTTKSKKGEVERKIEYVKGKISEKAKQVKEGARKMEEKGKNELKDILERGREFFCDVFVYTFSLEHLRSVMRLTHLLGFAVAYGMCIWVTFVSSYVLARALPRQQFAVVQSKIYPVYFKAMAYCVGPAFLAHFLSQKRPYANSAEALQSFNLLASISMLLVNLLYLEPTSTKVMFERLKLEKEEGRGRHIFNVEPSSVRGVDSVLDPTGGTKTTTTTISTAEKFPEHSPEVVKPQVVKLSHKLKKLNSYSSFLNVLTLMALTHHLVHLTQLLDAAS